MRKITLISGISGLGITATLAYLSHHTIKSINIPIWKMIVLFICVWYGIAFVIGILIEMIKKIQLGLRAINYHSDPAFKVIEQNKRHWGDYDEYYLQQIQIIKFAYRREGAIYQNIVNQKQLSRLLKRKQYLESKRKPYKKAMAYYISFVISMVASIAVTGLFNLNLTLMIALVITGLVAALFFSFTEEGVGEDKARTKYIDDYEIELLEEAIHDLLESINTDEDEIEILEKQHVRFERMLAKYNRTAFFRIKERKRVEDMIDKIQRGTYTECNEKDEDEYKWWAADRKTIMQNVEDKYMDLSMGEHIAKMETIIKKEMSFDCQFERVKGYYDNSLSNDAKDTLAQLNTYYKFGEWTQKFDNIFSIISIILTASASLLVLMFSKENSSLDSRGIHMLMDLVFILVLLACITSIADFLISFRDAKNRKARMLLFSIIKALQQRELSNAETVREKTAENSSKAHDGHD